MDINQVINIFLVEVEDTASEHYNDETGWGRFPNETTPTNPDLSYQPIVVMANMWYRYVNGYGGFWTYARLLNHEMGRNLGLPHSFTTDYCSDTPLNSNCYGLEISDPDCDNICELSNNMMDYNSYGLTALTPCQIGITNYWLVHGLVNNYVLKDYCEITEPPLVIDEPGQTIIWESKRIFKSDLIITSQTTLVIKCAMEMPKDASIIIEKGAKLILDGGTITKSCDGFWQGIEVWGNSSYTAHPSKNDIVTGAYPSSAAHHGVVWIKNGGTIEFARNAITTSKYDDYANQNYYGGIVLAESSTFRNKKRSAEFLKYDYYPYDADDDNTIDGKAC